MLRWAVRVLGVDFGRKRIGLAVSDASGLLARPWKTVGGGAPEQGARAVAEAVAALAADGEPVDVVVVGLPRRLSGEPTEQTAQVLALAARLRTLVAAEVEFQDERLSSREAESLLARRERDWRKRKPLLDAAAAAVILQDYLDSVPRRLGQAPGAVEGEGE